MRRDEQQHTHDDPKKRIGPTITTEAATYIDDELTRVAREEGLTTARASRGTVYTRIHAFKMRMGTPDCDMYGASSAYVEAFGMSPSAFAAQLRAAVAARTPLQSAAQNGHKKPAASLPAKPRTRAGPRQ